MVDNRNLGLDDMNGINELLMIIAFQTMFSIDMTILVMDARMRMINDVK